MKYLLIIFSFVLSGCAPTAGKYTDGNPGFFGREICKSGVVYYTNGQGIAPAFKPDGSLYTCEYKP